MRCVGTSDTGYQRSVICRVPEQLVRKPRWRPHCLNVAEVTLFDPDAKYRAAHACGRWLSGVLRTNTRWRCAGAGERRFIHKLSTGAAASRGPDVLELKESNFRKMLGFG